MFDVITFGSATRDIFIKSTEFKEQANKSFITGKALCVPLGTKLYIKDIHFLIGGGGVNTAVAFSRLGVKTAFLGMVGEDAAAQDILRELRESGVAINLILKTKKSFTNHSIILSLGKEDRTILSCRGAGEILEKKDIIWSKITPAKWFYISPLSEKLSFSLEELIAFAHRRKIKVAFNPGKFELALPRKKLRGALSKVDILILNQEEAARLTGIPYKKEAEIFKKIDQFCPGVAVMTKGPLGVVASDGKYLYRAKALPIKEADRTGAGDSFSAGFISGIILRSKTSSFIKEKGDIEYALQLGIANSAACLEKIGATKGLLKKGQRWKKVKVDRQRCS